MRKNLKTGVLLTVALILLGNLRSYAQIEEIGNLIGAGVEDAETLIQPYISPAVNAFGAALGGGWYNTAQPHQLGGFDITLTMNAAIIPEKYETFIIDNDQLINLQLADPADNTTPTIAGSQDPRPLMAYSLGSYTEDAFYMPEGLNSNYVPAPMLQVGIGLIKNTDIMVRYLPNIKYSDNEIGLWGLGGKHDIKQWIPGLKKLPVMQLSVMYGYTRLHTYVALDVDKSTIGAGSLPGEETNTWEDQQMTLIVNSHTANLLVSANLPVVCFYGGVGFVTTKTNLAFEGDYPVVYLDDTTPTVQALTDPIDMEIKNQDGSFTKPRLNAGVRFKFAMVTIHFDYSWANYSMMTGGLGVTFR